MVNRLEWDDYYLGIADAVAVRADCTRRQVGAVVVRDNSIIATGYNGSPPGEPGCLSDGACPRGRHYRSLYRGGAPSDGKLPVFGSCCGGCEQPWPCPDAVEAGSSYDTGPGTCIALHAEQNATIRAGSRSVGATLYCTDEPCGGCWKLLRGAGYDRIVWYGGEWVRTPEKKSLIMRVWRQM